MTEEEKAAAAAAEAEAKSKAEAGEIDFKAELEKATKAKDEKLKQAEFNIMKLKEELKNKPPASEIDISAIEESIKEKLLKETEAKFEQFKIEQAKGSIDSEIAKLSSNPEEQALIKFNYENKIVKSGFDTTSISEDLKTAHLISNRPRLEKTMDELRQKALSNMTKNGGEAAPSDPSDGVKKLSPDMEKWVKETAAKRGLTEAQVREKLAKNS